MKKLVCALFLAITCVEAVAVSKDIIIRNLSGGPIKITITRAAGGAAEMDPTQKSPKFDIGWATKGFFTMKDVTELSGWLGGKQYFSSVEVTPIEGTYDRITYGKPVKVDATSIDAINKQLVTATVPGIGQGMLTINIVKEDGKYKLKLAKNPYKLAYNKEGQLELQEVK